MTLHFRAAFFLAPGRRSAWVLSFCPPIRFQRPHILRLRMPENIKISIIRPDTKVNRLRAVPTVEHFLYRQPAAAQSKAQRPLVRFEAGVGFHLDGHADAASPAIAAISAPIASDAVAAGLGAFST